MDSMKDIDISEILISSSAVKPCGWERLRLPLYWLAGARWATLRLLPKSERERVAVIGSSVLIPTLLALFGMYLYASSRFHEPRAALTFFISIAWAFVIMNVDRILLATYRPFQPWFRKVLQVSFRIGLAGVVSVAIAFPFCLEQYRGAISERLQSEFYKRLHDLQTREQDERMAFEAQDAALIKDLRAQLDKEEGDGPADPQLYAEELAKEEVRKQNDSQRMRTEQLEKDKSSAFEEWQRASALITKLEQDRLNEARGTLSPERGGTGKPGQGAKYDELSRDLELARQEEGAARQRYHQLLKHTTLTHQSDPGREESPSLSDSKRSALMREGELRKTRIEELERAIKKAREDQTKHLADHESRYNPLIQSYQAKAKGIFDPMEETIGLFKVIFIPAPNSNEEDRTTQQYKWIAALFQFCVVFGTLFLLDLIAILSKVMSRPGPYDVLVEFPEFVSGQNLIAFLKEYPRFADMWAEAAMRHISPNEAAVDAGVDLREIEAVARMLLRAHLPTPMAAGARVSTYKSSRQAESPTDGDGAGERAA